MDKVLGSIDFVARLGGNSACHVMQGAGVAPLTSAPPPSPVPSPCPGRTSLSARWPRLSPASLPLLTAPSRAPSPGATAPSPRGASRKLNGTARLANSEETRDFPSQPIKRRNYEAMGESGPQDGNTFSHVLSGGFSTQSPSLETSFHVEAQRPLNAG